MTLDDNMFVQILILMIRSGHIFTHVTKAQSLGRFRKCDQVELLFVM